MASIGMVSGGWLPVIGAALLIALGIGLLLLRDGRPVQRAFSLYAISLGVTSGFSRFTWSTETANLVWYSVLLISAAGFGVGVLFVALRQGGWPQDRAGRTYAAIAAIATGTVTLGWGLANLSHVAALEELVGVTSNALFGPGYMVFNLSLAVSAVACVLLALRSRGGSPDDARAAAVLSTAIATYPSFFATGWLFIPNQFGQMFGIGAVAGVLVIAPAWLWATKGPAPRAARYAAWLPLGLALAGMLLGTWLQVVSTTWVAGAARILMVAIMAYAILRHHALEIDIRLRWGISKSTIAAIFVAAFFVVSEGAQTFFGAETGNEYYGIAAAGLLVLAIAPLQRFADKVADRAVPIQTASDAEGEYRELASMAWCDGSISGRERKRLRDARIRLGLDADTAELIETDVAVNSG